jgi:hypothetical protein
MSTIPFGVVTRGHVAARLGATLLAASCDRCERRGRLRLDDLLAALPMPALRRIVAAERLESQLSVA